MLIFNKLKKQNKKFKTINKTNNRYIISGRLNGVRMARNRKKYYGNTKTSSFNCITNYVSKNIYTKWGVWGIKLWSRNIIQ